MAVEFTTVVGVDEEHLAELKLVWPTWAKHRPEILRNPLLFICDSVNGLDFWKEKLSFVTADAVELVLWGLSDVDQREKMLTGLVFAAAEHVRTPWYLKLDTDTVAVTPSQWIDSQWFEPDEQGRQPSFIASPWGYTKPPDAIDRLDAWAATVPELAAFPPLAITPLPAANSVPHARIISWCFFGNTASTRSAAALCKGRLPVPSQDTYLWYVAQCRGEFFRRVPMKQFGWEHVSNRRHLAKICAYAMRPAQPASGGPGRSRRRSPSPEVAASLARAVSTLIPRNGRGRLIASIGNVVAKEFVRQRPDVGFDASDWKLFWHSENALRPSPSTGLRHDTYLDFIIVEAETERQQLTEVLESAWRNLKPGGVLAGINYGHPKDRRGQWAVRQTVDRLAKEEQSEVILTGNTVWIIPKPAMAPERPHPPRCVRESDISTLAVTTCFFSAAGDPRIEENYRHFSQSLRAQGIEPWTVEVAFGSEPYRLPASDRTIQLRGKSRLWQKERALNVLIQQLPSNYKSVAWVDCDVLFHDVDWIHKVCQALERSPLVQCFSNAEFLGPSGELDDFRASTASVVSQGHPNCRSFSTGHPGLAWAARRELLAAHGLYDRHITGGGDSLMAVASFGWLDRGILKRLPPGLMADFHKWADGWHQAIGGHVELLPGTVTHLWHGSIENRLYLARWSWLCEADFSPNADLRLDSHSLWSWSGNKPALEQRVANYFEWLREEHRGISPQLKALAANLLHSHSS